jgi:hypothetical protein
METILGNGTTLKKRTYLMMLVKNIDEAGDFFYA